MSENDGNIVDSRYVSLGRRVDHLDNRVSSMAEDMSSIKTSMDAIVQSVGELTHRAHNPTPTNWVGIGSLMLALVIAGGGYVTLTAEPMQRSIAALALKDQANDDLHAKRGEVIGKANAVITDNTGEIISLWQEMNKLKDKVETLGHNQAYNAGTSDALKERVEGIDNYGSRRWIDHKESKQ